MADAFDQTGPRADASAIGRWNAAFANAAKAAPPMLYALRLWAAVCLALFVAFSLDLDNPYWAGDYVGAGPYKVQSFEVGGPIILQAAVPVLDDDTVESLSARILKEEHRIYSAAIRMVLRASYTLENRRFRTA